MKGGYENEKNRIKMFHYKYRNTEIINKYYLKKNYHTLYQFCMIIVECIRYIGKKNGFTIVKVILNGFFESIFQYKSFETFIDKQLGE